MNPRLELRLITGKASKARRFEEGCRKALEACNGPALTDAEHNDLARHLGRPDLQRELQDPLDLGPSAA